jgi:predicted amidophosphoribosyltransferase
MTFDQMVRRDAVGTAEQPNPPSTTSFLRWCVHDISGTALICTSCDVSWHREEDELCWMCGEPGFSPGALQRAASVETLLTSR